MKLISLKLENFRQHKSTHLEFRDGMTAIVGANGTGKSTIVEAIRYALFGAVRGNLKDVKFYWAGRNRTRVTLVFEVAGRRWEAMRGDGDASLTLLDGDQRQTVVTGIRDTQARIERLLRLNDEQFTNSFCALQKGLSFLTFASNRKRQDEVGRMLGYERVRLAAALAGERRKLRDAELKVLQEGLGNPELLKADLEDAKKERTARQSELKDALTQLAQTEKVLAAAAEPAQRAEAWIKLEAERQEVSAQGRVLANTAARDEEEVKKRETESNEAAKLKPEAERYEACEQRVQSLKLDEQRHLSHLAALKSATEAEGRLKEAEAALASLPRSDENAIRKAVAEATARVATARNIQLRAMADWERAKSDARAALTKAETEAKAATKRLAEADELVKQGKCPQCGQTIGADFRTALEALESGAKAAAQAAEEAKAAFASLQGAPPALVSANEELRAAEVHHTACQAASEAAQKQHAAVVQATTRVEGLRDALTKARQAAETTRVAFDPSALEQAQADLGKLRPARDRYFRVKDASQLMAQAKERLQKTQSAFEALRQRAGDLDRRMSELGFGNRDEADAARQGLQRAESELKVAQAQKQMADQAVKAAEDRRARIQRQIEELEARRARIAETQMESNLFRHVGREMDTLREALNARIRPDLEARASELINHLTNERYSTIKLDEDFNATIVEADGTSKAVISGGEEDIVALALRLALSELIQQNHGMPMSLLILDEVYGSLDTERRQSVMDQLTALKSRFEQIIVISHIEETNQVADHTLFLSRDEVDRHTVVKDAPDAMPTILDLAVE